MATMTTKGTAKVTLPTDEQILITREFDAPKHLVYEAFTTPELVNFNFIQLEATFFRYHSSIRYDCNVFQ